MLHLVLLLNYGHMGCHAISIIRIISRSSGYHKRENENKSGRLKSEERAKKKPPLSHHQ